MYYQCTVEEWLRDLRSGEYKHGRNALAINLPDGSIGHCCLGVACETAKVEREGYKYNGLASTVEWNYEARKTVNEAAMANGFTGAFTGSLIAINDHVNTFDFTQQADLIEKYLPLDLVIEF